MAKGEMCRGGTAGRRTGEEASGGECVGEGWERRQKGGGQGVDVWDTDGWETYRWGGRRWGMCGECVGEEAVLDVWERDGWETYR